MRDYLIPVDIGGGELHALGVVERGSDAATKTGSTSFRVESRKLPTTITLAAAGTRGSVSAPLPDTFEHAPKIREALDARPPSLRVSRVVAPAAPPTDTSSTTPAAPSSTTTPHQEG